MTLVKEWTTPVLITNRTPASSVLLNEQLGQNMMYLIDRKTDVVNGVGSGEADLALSSTVFVSANSGFLTTQINTVTGNIWWSGTISYLADANESFYVGLKIDDDYYYGSNIGAGDTTERNVLAIYQRDVDIEIVQTITIPIIGLSAGVHTFEPVFKVSGGSNTVYIDECTVSAVEF